MAKSGKITVAAAGSAVALGTQTINGPLAVKALAGNSGLVYLGDDGSGDVNSSSGFELSAKEEIRLDYVGSLASIMLDAAVNGEGVCWLALNL